MLSFSVTVFLSSWQLHYLALSRNMKHVEQHLLAEPNRYANLFHSRRFDKLDCSSWKASFKHGGCCYRSPLPSFSFSSFPLHLLLPPHSFFPTFSLPSASQLVSICRALPLRIEKGPWPATTNLKRTGEGKNTPLLSSSLYHSFMKKTVEVLKIWNDAPVKGDEQVITSGYKGCKMGRVWELEKRQKINKREKRGEEEVERGLGP